MELEEMKTLWDDMSNKLEQQKVLTDKMIVDMTKQKYNNNLKDISIPETVGAIVCFAMAIYIIINIERLDTWYLLLCGLICIIFCILLPIVSLRSIRKIKNINVKSYKQSLTEYANGKKEFMQIQKLGFYLGFAFTLAILPVTSKLMSNKDLFMDSNKWMWAIPFMFVFHFIFSKWVFNRYRKVIDEASEILKDLKAS